MGTWSPLWVSVSHLESSSLGRAVALVLALPAFRPHSVGTHLHTEVALPHGGAAGASSRRPVRPAERGRMSARGVGAARVTRESLPGPWLELWVVARSASR